MQIVYLVSTTEELIWEALEDNGLAYKEYDPDDPDNQPPSNPMEAESFTPSGSYTWQFKVDYGALDMFGTIWVRDGTTTEGVDGPVANASPLDDNFYANLQLNDASFDTSNLPTVDVTPSTPYHKFLGQD
jgi:hypothetical protein